MGLRSTVLSILVLGLIAGSGCESSSSGGSGSSGGDAVDKSRIAIGACTADVMSWPITQSSVQASVTDEHIVFEGYNAEQWTPGFGAKNVNANTFVGYERADGTIYLYTWEYMPMGQNVRGKDFGGFRPVSGQQVYFMVAGICRDSRRNVEERSNISVVTWP